MEVRKALRSDLLGVGRVIHAAAWESCTGLLKPSTVAEILAAQYSPSALKRRLLEGGLVVAVDDRQVVVGAAIAEFHDDYIEVGALFIDPDHRRRGIGTLLIEELDRVAAGLPLCFCVLLGATHGEQFSESLGFVPGEIIEREIFGEQVVERRWWRTAD